MKQVKTRLPAAADIRMGQVLETWIASLADYSPTTVATYKTAIKLYIRPTFGAYRVRDICGLHIDQWIAELRSDKVGAAMVEKSYLTLSAAFTYAVSRKMVDTNPCAVVAVPRAATKEVEVFTVAEIRSIMDATSEDRLAGVYRLLFHAGLRQGEIFGLQWGDLNDASLFIRRQVIEAAGKVVIRNQTKTSAGRRTITLDQMTLDSLLQRRRFAMKEGLAAIDWMFPTKKGEPFRRSNFGSRHWRPLLKHLGIRHRGAHHARHTAATLMLSAGTPVHTVAQHLGHSGASVTQKIYAHWIPADGERAASAVSKAIGG